MGLLDSLFDPQTYGGDGGLLSRLQPMLSALPQSQGFAPQSANPIGVGGYQMPRIGNPDLYDPQQVALPPNSQPTQGQTPVGMQQPAQQMQTGLQQPAQQALPPALGGSQFGGAGLQNFLNTPGGLLQKVVGGIGGAVTGQRTDPLGMQQQNLKAQYDSLVPIVGPQKALLAVMNPEAGKTILTEALTNKNEVKDVQDSFGGHHLMWVNPLKPGVAVGVGGNSENGGQGGGADLEGVINKINAMKAQGATRDQLIGQIPAGFRDDVDALVNGKAVPANMGRAALRGPLNILAHAVDGNYDETQIPGRIQMRKDFMGEGKNGQAIGAFNTAQHHIDKLSDDLETLAKFHGNYPAVNSIKDWFSANVNSNPHLRDTVQSVKTDMAAVSHEVANAYNAGHLSDHDMATWNALTNSDLPPDQLRRGISDFVDLLNGKRDSLNHMYRQQFGQDAPSIESDKNDAITKKVHQRSPQYGDSLRSSGLPSGWSVKVR